MTEVVYAIGSPQSTLVKIGRSIDANERLGDIQRMSPVRLVLLWTTPGGSALESALHFRFKDRRSHGEWFDFADANAVELIAQAAAELTLTPEEEAAIYARLEQDGNERVAWERKRDVIAEQLRNLAVTALRNGMRPSRVAKATGFTDSYIRQLRNAAKRTDATS